jgi:hypothetical protein
MHLTQAIPISQTSQNQKAFEGAIRLPQSGLRSRIPAFSVETYLELTNLIMARIPAETGVREADWTVWSSDSLEFLITE